MKRAIEVRVVSVHTSVNRWRKVTGAIFIFESKLVLIY